MKLRRLHCDGTMRALEMLRSVQEFPVPTLAFVIASLVILMTPGPTNTLLAAFGATFGFRRATVMVLAEALGYAVAISLFASLADLLTSTAMGLSMLKIAAAVWLLVSARTLWRSKPSDSALDPSRAFRRVLVTTMLNPKAMIVGVMLIPHGLFPAIMVWTGAYVTLSIAVGLVWTAAGSLLPSGIRQHAYQAAAIILGGFSFAAAASALP